MPGGSLPKQYGVGFNKPTPIPENPFKNKVSPFLPPAGTTPKVQTNLGYISGQLPLQVNVPTPAQTYKDKAVALKEQIAAQQKALTPYRGVSSSMMAATQTQAQALPKDVSSMGLPMTTVVKPQQQAAVEQTIANLKGELAQAQNAGYAADYSQQWAALNKRTDANYIKARLARMATLRDSFGSDHSQNVGAMTEYQRIRGELEKLGVNAEGLSDWLQRNSDYLEAAQEMAESQQYATDKPLRASLASVGKNLVSGQGALAGIAQQGMNTNSGEYRPINVYGDAFDASREKQAIRGTVGENIAKNHGQAAKFLYDIGMSMADSGATALTAGLTGAGGAASIILGSAVASDTMMNVVERGGSTDQAVTAGVLAGAAETIFESISLGKFLDTFKSAGAKSAKEIAKNALLQGVTEMSEEMATEVSNIIVDEVVMGSLSELNQMRANGATEAQITGEIAKRIGLAGLGGFLSGGIFGTVGSLNNRTENPTITRREQRALDALSQKTGVNIQIDDDIKGSNGYFDRNTNTLHISRNSNNAVYQVAAHEISHAIESNPEEWNQLYEIANANLSAEARSNLEDLLKATGYTDAQMQSEVVSHYVQQCVTDIKSFEQLVGVNRTLAQRIVDAFETFVRKLTGQQNIGSWQETAQLREFIGDITPEQAQQTLAQMKKALAAGGQATGEGTQHSKRLLTDGSSVVVIPTNIFEGKTGKKHEIVADYIADHIGEVYTIIESGQKVYIGEDLPGEYTHSKATQTLLSKRNKSQLNAKNQASQEFGELIEIATNRRWEEAKDKVKHAKDAKYGFYKYDTKFAIPANNAKGYEVYNATLLIRNDADGKKYLYDILGIKENSTANLTSTFNKVSQWGAQNAQAVTVSNTNNTQNSNSVNNQNSLKLSPEAIKQNADTAEQYFGTTISPKTAGYLTVNGRMLDFSGRKFGAPGYSRTMDHREITDAFGDDYGGDGYSDGMIQFMAEGNIRLAPESGGIDLCVKPNELQEIQLQRYIRTFGGEVIVDFSRENGDIDGSVEYPARTPASLILQEIRDYFDKGKMPENFDYSRKLNFEGGRKLVEQRTGRGLPYNPNAPKTIPQNPAQGKFGEPMGIVANPEAVARAQERREFFQPKPNPEGSRNIEGSVLDNLGQGQAAFAALDNLLAQSKADAAKKPGAKEGIANVLTQRPKKFSKDNLEEHIDKIARKVVDSGRTIDTIGKAVDDKVLYPLYNNAKQSRQAAEYMIGEAQTDINGNRVGESLVSIFDPIKAQGEDYFRDFSTYLYHLHNVDRMSLETNGAQVYQDAIMQLEAENPMLQNATREEVEALASGNSDYREAAIEWLQLDDSLNDLHNKPVFGESVTAEVSRKAAAELARKNPEFAELAEKVYAYNRNLMKYRVDAGLVSQKQADIMNTLYPHYVPTFRDTSSTTGMKISGNQAKVARTVRSATGSNLDLLRIDDSMAEQTMQTVRAAKQNLLGARLLEDALKHQDKVGRHVRSVIDRYNSYDMDEPPQLGNDITIYVGGKPVSMQADDGVMEAFQSIQPRKGERIAGLEAVAKANNTFKRLVTGANPTFLIKNFARDLQDAGLYSGNLIDFAKNYPKAWQEMVTGGELWQLYKSQGGTGSSYFDYEKGLKTEGKKNIFDQVEELNMMVEQAPRFAEFVSVLEKEGRTYAGIQRAMLAAADVTVNFGRGGSATQFLNRTFVPFLNPAVQGADKLVRRFSETKGAKEWVGLVGRLALMGVVPALLNELLYDDDEEYQMLNDRDKENNYVFPIGDGVWVKIPKGRALSVFGSTAQRTARFLKGDKDAFNGFIQQAYDQVGVPNPLTNNIFSQVLNADLLDPESPGKTWYGSDIEPQRLQGLPPAERYDEKTDELSKWLGKQLNISPKKINYLLDNYSGVIGDFLLPLSTPQAERNPFASAFTIDSVTSNKLSEEFYTKLDELEQAKNSKTPTAGAAAAYRYMNGVSSEVSANNKKIREIQNDKSLTDKEKLEQVRKVRNTNNKLLKDAVDNLPGYMETASKSGVVSGKALDKVYLQTNYKQFGAEYALKKYDSAVYEKAKLANTRGITYEDYYNYKFSVDANGDGSVSQEEAKKKLDSMSITSYQKAFLWEQQNKSWKKNPYK